MALDGPLAKARAVAYAPTHRTVDQHSGEIAKPTECQCGNPDVGYAIHRIDEPCFVASSGTSISWREDADALGESRAEVAHYADLNRVLGEALRRATDTANNAVIQEQELRDELDEMKRDAQELWERAVRVGELEQRNGELGIELAAALGSREAWIANANEADR